LATGLGPPAAPPPHLHRDRAHPCQHLHQN
jgi:hypothetical protein